MAGDLPFFNPGGRGEQNPAETPYLLLEHRRPGMKRGEVQQGQENWVVNSIDIKK